MRSSSKFLRDSRGVVLILVAVFVPVLFLGVKYLIDKGKVSFAEANRAGIARTIARTVQEKYKPEYSWDSQKDKIWQACVDVVKERYKKTIADNGLTLTLETESEDEARKGQLYVVCDCNFINKIAKAYIEELDADIVISIPTTNTTKANTTNHIVKLSSACSKFLADLDFYRVACGVIPYSGKITMFDEGAVLWCTTFDKLSRPTYNDIKQPNSDYEVKYPTLKLFDLYSAPGGSEFYNLGYLYGGRSQSFIIMYRKNDFLLSTDDPAESDAKKFLLANIWPCSAGNYSVLAGRSVPESSNKFVAPYSMSTLTAGVTTAKQVFLSMQEIYDSYNTSNFLFLPVLWTNLLLNQSWTLHPTCHNPNGGKKRFAVLIANSANKFTTGELTYLGFSNDAATIPVPETTRLEITDSSQYAYDAAHKIEYVWNNGSPYICVRYPGLVTVKVEKIKGTTDDHTVEFLNIIKDDNLALKPDQKYTLHRDDTEFFIHPKQLVKEPDTPLYRIGLKLGNTRVSSIELTNRKFNLVEDSYSLSQNGNEYTIHWDHLPQPFIVKVVTSKKPSVTFTDKNSKTETHELNWNETQEFTFSYSSAYTIADNCLNFTPCSKDKFKYKLHNCSIKSIILTNRCIRCAGPNKMDEGMSVKSSSSSGDYYTISGKDGSVWYDWRCPSSESTVWEGNPAGKGTFCYCDEGKYSEGEGTKEKHSQLDIVEYCAIGVMSMPEDQCDHEGEATHTITIGMMADESVEFCQLHDYDKSVTFKYAIVEQAEDGKQEAVPPGENEWVSFIGGGNAKVTVVAPKCNAYFMVPKNNLYEKIELPDGSIDLGLAPSRYRFTNNSITITTENAEVESISRMDGAYYTCAEFASDAESDAVCVNCSNNALIDDVDIVGIEGGRQFKILTAGDQGEYSSRKWIANCNRALIRDYYQRNFSDAGETESLSSALDSLTQNACTQLKNAGVEKIYLIKYGIETTVLDPYADAIYYIDLNDKEALKQTFDEIAADIKQSTLKTGKIVIREKDQEQEENEVVKNATVTEPEETQSGTSSTGSSSSQSGTSSTGSSSSQSGTSSTGSSSQSGTSSTGSGGSQSGTSSTGSSSQSGTSSTGSGGSQSGTSSTGSGGSQSGTSSTGSSSSQSGTSSTGSGSSQSGTSSTGSGSQSGTSSTGSSSSQSGTSSAGSSSSQSGTSSAGSSSSQSEPQTVEVVIERKNISSNEPAESNEKKQIITKFEEPEYKIIKYEEPEEIRTIIRFVDEPEEKKPEFRRSDNTPQRGS